MPMNKTVGHALPTSEHWEPENEADRLKVRGQLERILASPLFRNSKRYPTLLRYVVEHTLRGDSECIKERTLGIEVLGRDPDYDTNTDHSVRSVAVEIRKRLAQYYQDPSHEAEIRIELPSGSYVPVFRQPAVAAPEPVTTADPQPPPVPSAPGMYRSRAWLVWTAFIFIVGLATAILWPSHRLAVRQTALDRFWSPLLTTPAPATLFLGYTDRATIQGSAPSSTALPMTVLELHQTTHKVHFSDAVTLGRLTGLLETRSKGYRVLYEPDATFADFREGPVVLIGGFNNSWTLRLTGMLRFAFETNADNTRSWIVDRQHPSMKSWSVDWTLPYLQLTDDYAVVTRVIDPTTEELVIVVAGIGKYGTLAAGEFVTSPAHMEQLERLAPSAWTRKNLQVVLSTKVIKGSNGPPSILATYFW